MNGPHSGPCWLPTHLCWPRTRQTRQSCTGLFSNRSEKSYFRLDCVVHDTVLRSCYRRRAGRVLCRDLVGVQQWVAAGCVVPGRINRATATSES